MHIYNSATQKLPIFRQPEIQYRDPVYTHTHILSHIHTCTLTHTYTHHRVLYFRVLRDLAYLVLFQWWLTQKPVAGRLTRPASSLGYMVSSRKAARAIDAVSKQTEVRAGEMASWLLFQRTWILLPAPTEVHNHLQLQFRGIPMSSSGLHDMHKVIKTLYF